MSSARECLVWGALALTLQMSRLAGVAPLRLVRDGDEFRASVSRNFALYSYALMLALHTGILVGIVLDFNLDEDHSVIARTPTSTAIWIMEVLVVTSIVTVGVFGSSSRMEQMIESLNIVQAIQSQTIHKTLKGGTDRKVLLWAALAIALANWYYAQYLWTFLHEAVTANKDWRVVLIYSCFFFEFLMMTLLELQFIFVAHLIECTLKSINDTLNHIIYNVDAQRTLYTTDYLISSSNMDDITIPVHSVNIVVDKMLVREKLKNIAEAEMQDSIRELTVNFCTICDEVRRVDRIYGKVMLLLVGSFILYLIVPPYYFFSFLLSPKRRRLDVVLQVINYIFHCTYLVMAVEPGHRTSLEMEHTQLLVTDLLRRVSSAQEWLAIELDFFNKQIQLNKVSYSPMGVCTLARPLVPAIFGTSTTFMVVILQYQGLDTQKW